jgi:hypothetical protein
VSNDNGVDGFAVSNSVSVTLRNATAAGNVGSGFWVTNSTAVVIDSSAALENLDGILLSGTGGNHVIKGSFFGDNSRLAINGFGPGGSLIYSNEFAQNASDIGTNTWDHNSVGNHWAGYDQPSEGCWDNGSGICNLPLAIPGGSNYDRYPLVNAIINKPDVQHYSCDPGLAKLRKTGGSDIRGRTCGCGCAAWLEGGIA